MLVCFGSSRPGRGWQGVGHAQAGEGGGNDGCGQEKDKEVGEQDDRDVEDCKLSLNNDAEDESAKVGESRGEKERGEADEGGDGAGLPHNLPANLLAKGPTSAVR